MQITIDCWSFTSVQTYYFCLRFERERECESEPEPESQCVQLMFIRTQVEHMPDGDVIEDMRIRCFTRCQGMLVCIAYGCFQMLLMFVTHRR